MTTISQGTAIAGAAVLALGGCSDAPDEPHRQPVPVAPVVQHLFDRPLTIAEYAPGAFPEDLVEVLGGECVWIVDERIPHPRLPLASSPRAKHRVYRANTLYPVDGTQRRAALEDAADPEAGEWIDPSDVLSIGNVRPGEVLIGPDTVLFAPPEGEERADELVVTYPVEPSTILQEVTSPPGAVGEPPVTFELTLLNETRRSVLWPVGSRLAWSLCVPEGAELRLGCGARRVNLSRRGPGVAVSHDAKATVRFFVSVRDEGDTEPTVVWEDRAHKAGAFQEVRIDLSPYAGRTVELSLVSAHTGDTARPVHPVWAEPVLAAAERGARPNVVVVLLDTLRADRLGCYGWQRADTPSIDALAAQGVRFDQAWSAAPWTIPSHASLFSSTYATEHGVWNRWQRLPSSTRTLAEAVRDESYATAAFTGGGFVRSRHGFAQGFDLFVTTPRDDATIGFDRAWEWMQAVGPPFFAFVHTYQVHSPFDPPEPYRSAHVREYDGELPASVQPAQYSWGRNQDNELSPEDVRYLQDLYDAEIAAVDRIVGKLFDRLRQAGWLENTLVLLTSDHGEEFSDHGHFDHGFSLYQEQLRVPLLLYQKGRFEGGRVATHPVHGVDVAPTVLAAIGASSPADWSGIPLTVEPPPGERPLYLPYLTRDRGRPAFALMIGARKYIDFPDELRPCDPLAGPRLFDLAEDPGERTNLWDEDGGRRWRSAVRDLSGRHPQRSLADEVGDDHDLIDELRSLGYLGDE